MKAPNSLQPKLPLRSQKYSPTWPSVHTPKHLQSSQLRIQKEATSCILRHQHSSQGILGPASLCWDFGGRKGKQTWTPFRSLASYQCLFLNRTHCRAMTGRNVKVPMNTYIYCTSFPETEAPVYRPPLPPGASATATAKRGECLRNPPGARLPRRVFLGRLGPALLLGL